MECCVWVVGVPEANSMGEISRLRRARIEDYPTIEQIEFKGREMKDDQ